MDKVITMGNFILDITGGYTNFGYGTMEASGGILPLNIYSISPIPTK